MTRSRFSGTLLMQIVPPTVESASLVPLSVTTTENTVPSGTGGTPLSLTVKLAPVNGDVPPGPFEASFSTFVNRSLPTGSQKSDPAFVPAGPPSALGETPGWQLSMTSLGGLGNRDPGG